MVLMEQNPNNVLSDINNKIRTLESKGNVLSEHLLTINQNTIEEYKRINKQIELLNEDIRGLKEELFNLKQTIKAFLGEVDFFAKKNDIKVLEKYINLWNPLEFVREDEIEKIVEEKMAKLKKGDESGRK